MDEGFGAVHDTIGSGHGDGCASHGSLKATDAMRAAHGEPAGRPMASGRAYSAGPAHLGRSTRTVVPSASEVSQAMRPPWVSAASLAL